MKHRERVETDGEIYLAGQRVPPGRYRQIGNGRVMHLTVEDVLPASLDGRVACYERIAHAWSDRHQSHRPHAPSQDEDT